MATTKDGGSPPRGGLERPILRGVLYVILVLSAVLAFGPSGQADPQVTVRGIVCATIALAGLAASARG